MPTATYQGYDSKVPEWPNQKSEDYLVGMETVIRAA